MTKEKKITFHSIIQMSPIIVGILLVALFSYTRFVKAPYSGSTKVLTSSTLKDAINISQLSTAQFTYNGIATIYDKHDKVKCHIKYDAKVKAGVDLSKVDFQIDEGNKTISITLPPVEITANPIDEKQLSFIPSGTDLELKDAFIACKNDAQEEAKKSSELISSAEQNSKSIIEGLLLPIISSYNFSIVWM